MYFSLSPPLDRTPLQYLFSFVCAWARVQARLLNSTERRRSRQCAIQQQRSRPLSTTAAQKKLVAPERRRHQSRCFGGTRRGISGRQGIQIARKSLRPRRPCPYLSLTRLPPWPRQPKPTQSANLFVRRPPFCSASSPISSRRCPTCRPPALLGRWPKKQLPRCRRCVPAASPILRSRPSVLQTRNRQV